MAKKPAKRWVKTEIKPKLFDATKKQVKATCDEFIDRVFRPHHVRTEPLDFRFNYIVDLYTKWYRNYFYFCTTYRCPSENCISEFFETKYTRLEYRAEDKYNVSYMRHTGQWFVVFHDLSLDECLKIIEENEFFHPV